MSGNSFASEKRRVAHRGNPASVQLMRDLAFKKQSMSQMVNRLGSSKRERNGKKENRFFDLLKPKSPVARSRNRKVASSDDEEEFTDDEEDVEDESFDEDLERNVKRKKSVSPSLTLVEDSRPSSSELNVKNEENGLKLSEESDSGREELIGSVPTSANPSSWLCKPRLNGITLKRNMKKHKNSGVKRKRAVISSSDDDEAEVDAMQKAPLTLKLTVKRAKRLQKNARASDESDAVDSEGSAFFSDESNSDDSLQSRSKRKSFNDSIRLRATCVTFFNVASRDKLMEAPRMTDKVANFILENRPFTDFDDLQLRVSACPRGSAIPELYLEFLENRGILERILDDCRAHSKRMQEALESVDNNQLLIQPKLLGENCELHEYQLVGLNWLIMMHKLKLNAILGDEMGLGKTIQVIAFLAYLKEKSVRGPHLVVCPSSTIENWMVEFAKWAPSIEILTYYGSMEDRMRLRAMATGAAVDVLLTTYNMIGSKPEDRKFFKRFRINYAIYDEGHLLKNCTTERYKNLMKVRKTPLHFAAILSLLQGERKILMTGTPLQNNLIELISLMYFTMTKLFTEYCDDITQLMQQFQQKIPALAAKAGSLFGADKIEQAKAILQPYILRRLKSNVLGGLPKKHEKVIYCELLETQKEIYNDLVREFRELEMTGEKAASSRLMQLRQISNHPLLYRRQYVDEVVIQIAKVLCRKEDDYLKKNPDHVAEDLAFLSDFAINQLCLKYSSTQQFCLDEALALESGKFKELDKILPPVKEKGEKVLIFSQFTTVLDILEVYLGLRGYEYCRLDGSTPVMERQELINTFNSSDDLFVFLLSTKAGGMGINLAAANHIILHDIDFNPYNDKQAEDRCHRMGQEKEVFVVRLISSGTVEEAILNLAQKKLELEKEITGNSAQKGAEDESQIVEKLLKKALAS